MQSNLKGCFAAGDIVGTPYQYIKSAGEGNIAALSAVSYIDKHMYKIKIRNIIVKVVNKIE